MTLLAVGVLALSNVYAQSLFIGTINPSVSVVYVINVWYDEVYITLPQPVSEHIFDEPTYYGAPPKYRIFHRGANGVILNPNKRSNAILQY